MRIQLIFSRICRFETSTVQTATTVEELEPEKRNTGEVAPAKNKQTKKSDRVAVVVGLPRSCVLFEDMDQFHAPGVFVCSLVSLFVRLSSLNRCTCRGPKPQTGGQIS
ncbi:hypothetical protein NPIL_13661 [Nephila pilipes]|uniref:Uncharacterized protein n=1 Tax=Nephila pilipes TaxID=299642 RepID=A0A8X6T2F7_NEPPI|nr:hypothetical protein NPIL_13661 [Nephila pilipes]